MVLFSVTLQRWEENVRGDFILINVDTHSEGKVEGLSADNSAAVFVLLTPVAASDGRAVGSAEEEEVDLMHYALTLRNGGGVVASVLLSASPCSGRTTFLFRRKGGRREG